MMNESPYYKRNIIILIQVLFSFSNYTRRNFKQDFVCTIKKQFRECYEHIMIDRLCDFGNEEDKKFILKIQEFVMATPVGVQTCWIYEHYIQSPYAYTKYI
jgi:hypothetical protein